MAHNDFILYSAYCYPEGLKFFSI